MSKTDANVKPEEILIDFHFTKEGLTIQASSYEDAQKQLQSLNSKK
jgi:hypothetical protein